jgi:serine/threonine protein phosphatase PrpC
LFLSTALFCIVTDTAIHVANVGDTRAVLASQSKDKNNGKAPLSPVQLTQEHRPDENNEFTRITFTGSRVHRLIDTNGNLKGPYRVWESNRNTPGLTVSRSLGNPTSKMLGIIAEPTTSSCKIKADKDHFLVLATDGLWDVMDNQEVINFVEANRDYCLKGTDVPTDEEEIGFFNTCVAQLLCEEARSRWVMKIEDEEAVMDDVSCVVVELRRCEENIEVVDDAAIRNLKLEEEKERETRKAPTLKDTITKESNRRISVVGISAYNSKTEMV